MRLTWRGGGVAAVWFGGLVLAVVAQAQENPRDRRASRWYCMPGCAKARPRRHRGLIRRQGEDVQWDPAQTAVIICDMWNQHWCQGATRRVGELAPAMNKAVAAARAKGVLHHPRPQ